MNKKQYLFNNKRYMVLLIAVLIILLGFILMSGGGSDNPEIFNDEIYSFRRIRLAPLVVLSGFILCIVSILFKEKD